MIKIKKIAQKISDYMLYGVLFSLIAFISSLFMSEKFTLTPPVAHADIPSGSTGGTYDGNDSLGGNGGLGDNCDTDTSDAPCD